MGAQSIEFIGTVESGHLPEAIRQNIAASIRASEGKKIIVSLRPFTKRRSCQQNAFYWGVAVPLIRQMFFDAGTVCSAEEIHLFLKQYVGKITKEITKPDGEICSVPAESKKLTTAEWEDYLTAIRAWAAEFGCIIPMPNESGF